LTKIDVSFQNKYNECATNKLVISMVRREIMKSTGIIRKVDDLGRIVLPIELRRSLGIGEQDPLEIFVQDDSIVLRKSSAVCIFCGSDQEIEEYMGKGVCGQCRANLRA